MSRKKVEKEELDFFAKLKKNIDKNVAGVHASVLSQSKIAKDRWSVKTPCMDLNRILAGSLEGGIQSRNLVAIVGPEHTMKSSFMVLCMVNAQKQGYKPIIIDTEGGCTEEFCQRWGLDTDNLFYIYTPWISEVKSILAQIKATGDEKLVIGLDSVGGLERLKSYDDALDGKPKADQGLLQKEIRSTLKLFLNVCINQNCIGIATGHYYGKPSTVPSPDQIGGGKAMKLFPSIIISLRKEPLKDGDAKDAPVIGSIITATTLKNRYYPPFQTSTIRIDYNDGVQPFAGIVDLGVEAGLIQKNGAWYSYGDYRLGQGMINATQALEEDNFDELLKDIDGFLSTTGYSSVSTEVQEAEELLKEEEVKEPKKLKTVED
jgi:recombination protein RecA